MAQIQAPSQPPFTPPESQIRILEVSSFVLGLLGIVISILVLFAYAVVAYQGPESRRCLDRVSFRLLVGALVSNVMYGITLTISHTQGGKDPECGVGAFIMNLGFLLGILFTACIAVNSQLVLVHEFNGKALERFYIITSVILALITSAFAYGSGQLGWNEDLEWCWYSNPDTSTRLHWIIATQYSWVALIAVVESISSFCVLFWLYRSKSTIFSLFRRANRRDETAFSTAVMLGQDPKYLRIIIRIALYPIVSVFLNFFTLAIDLHLSIVGVTDVPHFHLLILDMFLLGSRNIIYGMLAFGDPSFLNAVHDLSGRPPALTTRGFNEIASQFLSGALTALNLKRTSTESTLSGATGTFDSATGLVAEAGPVLPPFEIEREDFQRFGTQL